MLCWVYLNTDQVLNSRYYSLFSDKTIIITEYDFGTKFKQ